MCSLGLYLGMRFYQFIFQSIAGVSWARLLSFVVFIHCWVCLIQTFEDRSSQSLVCTRLLLPLSPLLSSACSSWCPAGVFLFFPTWGCSVGLLSFSSRLWRSWPWIYAGSFPLAPSWLSHQLLVYVRPSPHFFPTMSICPSLSPRIRFLTGDRAPRVELFPWEAYLPACLPLLRLGHLWHGAAAAVVFCLLGSAVWSLVWHSFHGPCALLRICFAPGPACARCIARAPFFSLTGISGTYFLRVGLRFHTLWGGSFTFFFPPHLWPGTYRIITFPRPYFIFPRLFSPLVFTHPHPSILRAPSIFWAFFKRFLWSFFPPLHLLECFCTSLFSHWALFCATAL